MTFHEDFFDGTLQLQEMCKKFNQTGWGGGRGWGWVRGAHVSDLEGPYFKKNHERLTIDRRCRIAAVYRGTGGMS